MVLDRREAAPLHDVAPTEVRKSQKQRGGIGKRGGRCGPRDRCHSREEGGGGGEQATCAAAAHGVRTIFSASRAS